MSDLTPYQQAKAARLKLAADKPPPPGRRARFTPEVARARALDRQRRNAEAHRRAWTILADRYPEDFNELLADELRGVWAERGHLIGDPE